MAVYKLNENNEISKIRGVKDEKYPELNDEVYGALAKVVNIAERSGYFVKKAELQDAVDYFLNRFYKAYAGPNYTE